MIIALLRTHLLSVKFASDSGLTVGCRCSSTSSSRQNTSWPEGCRCAFAERRTTITFSIRHSGLDRLFWKHWQEGKQRDVFLFTALTLWPVSLLLGVCESFAFRFAFTHWKHCCFFSTSRTSLLIISVWRELTIRETIFPHLTVTRRLTVRSPNSLPVGMFHQLSLNTACETAQETSVKKEEGTFYRGDGWCFQEN